MNSRSSQDTAAARQFYSRLSRVYDALADADEARARQLGLDLLAPRPGERILEIGFGTGTSLLPIARAVGDSGRVMGVDIADGMRDVAAERLRAGGLDRRVDLVVDAIPPVPAGTASFDAVFMAFTLELFPDDSFGAVLDEVRRVLGPAGRFVAVAMDVGTPEQQRSLAERTYQWAHRHFPHIVDCRPIDVERLLSSEGFTVDRHETLAIWGLAVKACHATPRSAGPL